MDLLTNIKNKLDSMTGDYLGLYIPDITLIDVIEVIIIAFVMYKFLIWCKNSRAWTLLKGILVIVLVFVIAAILQMSTILWLGERLLNVALLAVVVLFQPELRKALDGLGSRSISADSARAKASASRTRLLTIWSRQAMRWVRSRPVRLL